MASAKLSFKTPLSDLLFVNISGKGKKKYDPQGLLSDEDENFQFTATARLTKEQADTAISALAEFWKNNKPAGATKQKYDLIKPEVRKVIGSDGQPTKDEDGAYFVEPTGFYTFQAKTSTHWQDGKPNYIKVLRANGQPLELGTNVIGDGSQGVIHCTIGINGFKGNEGLLAYLTAVQLKKFVPYTGSDVQADDLGDDDLGDLGLDDDLSRPAI